VQQVYRWIVDNYEPDDEIFFFGFSRGAYTARSTVGLIRNCGVLRREHAERLGAAYALYRSRSVRPADPESELFRRAYSHPARVRFIGVWDTVGSVGIPSVGFGIAELVNRRCGFHDTRLSRIVDTAYQALAIDEQRTSFRPAVWQPAPHAPGQQVEQVWFSGVHCDVGGGYPDSSLADIALLWMVDRAQRSGLALRDDAYRRPSRGGPRAYDGRTYPVEPDPRGELHDSRRGVFRLQGAYSRPLGTHHPGTESVADSAVARHRDPDLGYAPQALVTCLQGPHGTTPVPVDWPPPEPAPASGPPAGAGGPGTSAGRPL
jgi:hypothetical protein